MIGALASAVELRYDNYDALPDDTRAAVIDRTAEIKANIRTVEAGALTIGKRLAEVKAMLRYGEFGRWCDQEFAWSQDTAWRLMRVAEVWGDISEQIPRIAESAPRSVLSLLAAPNVPEAVRQEVVERAASGQRTTLKDAAEILQRHGATPKPKPAPAPELTNGPVFQPIRQPQPEPEDSTPLQAAMLNWVMSKVPPTQRLFALKDIAMHRQRSSYWTKATDYSEVIRKAGVGQVVDAANWAKLQVLDAAPEVLLKPATMPEIRALAVEDISDYELRKALQEAYGLPKTISNRDLLAAVLRGPANTMLAGPGQLIIWHTEDGRHILRLHNGSKDEPWLEMDAAQADWLAKELTQ